MSTVLVMVALLSFFLVASRDLKLGILLVLTFLPSYLIRFSIGPIPTTLLEMLMVSSILIFFLKKFPLAGLSTSPFKAPIILFLLASTIAVFVAPNHLAALGIWRAYFVEPILFFFVVRSTLTSEQDKQHTLKALGIGALLVSLFAIIQYFTGYGIPAPWDFERRVTSFFDYPNAVGLFVAPIVSIALLQLVAQVRHKHDTTEPNEKSSKEKYLWLSVVIFGLLAIVLAKTEAALVAIPLALFSLYLLDAFPCFIRPDKTRKWKLLLALASFVILVALVLSIAPVREKLFLQDSSGLVRRSQWRETSQMLQDHWLLGGGLSGYPSALEPYHTDTQYEIFQYPHNLILNIWSELGLLGLVAFIWLALRVLGLSVSPCPLSMTHYCILAALLTMTIHGLVDVPYFKNDLALMTWTLLALVPLKTT